MMKLILAAAFVLTATSASLAQTGFNPGTVVGNVYESPACVDVCAFGYSPPRSGYGSYAAGYGYYYAPAYRHHRKKVAPVRN